MQARAMAKSGASFRRASFLVIVLIQLCEAQQADPPGVDAEGKPAAPVVPRRFLAVDPGHQLARDLDR